MSYLFNDQANSLREEFVSNETKIISVVSGKGGVGKSIFSVNVAALLASYDKKVLLFDSDAGFANASILLGSTIQHTLSDYMKGTITFKECIQDTMHGVKIVSTGFDYSDWKIFQNNFDGSILNEFLVETRDTDYLIIDVGAGYSEKLNNFYLNSDKIFIITAPEPTAVVNAYSLLKALSYLGVNSEIEIVLNMTKNKEELDNIKYALSSTVKKFLNKDINSFYELSYDPNVPLSVKAQIPVVIMKKDSKFSKDIKKIVDNILNLEVSQKESSFAKRIKKLFGLES
ncbi:MAG TPA: P-loop NTPase [Defluviitoga sp.]|nr:P-loop NTPase [Defluviitoga sp.]HOP24887.1 P-loop NTPase [Defluviitoga sp.]HPZ28782.1 P-loop NTPase [Defluviitoga sp.]HQD62875.1 P-loop NTPase [Defluviitoga sp.]